MHHFTFISFKSESHTLFPSRKGQSISRLESTTLEQVRKKKMEHLEQENKELRGKLTSMQSEMEKLTAMVTTLMAAQN